MANEPPVIIEKDGQRLMLFSGFAALHAIHETNGQQPPFSRNRRSLEEAYAGTDSLRRQWRIVPARLTLRVDE